MTATLQSIPSSVSVILSCYSEALGTDQGLNVAKQNLEMCTITLPSLLVLQDCSPAHPEHLV